MITRLNIKSGKEVLKKYKRFIFEFIINIFSFSLLIVIQQIIALPIISRFYEPDYFGKIILLFGITNILTSMFGFSIGNARLLDESFYNVTYIKILHINNIIVFLVAFIAYNIIYLNGNQIEAIAFSFIAVLGNIRFFVLSEYRIRDRHDWIFKQNLYYFLGVLVGLLAFTFIKSWLIIFLVAELFSVVLPYVRYLKKKGFYNLFRDREYLNKSNTFQLMINNGVTYSLNQYERFTIFPILGAASVGVFYSASVSAKFGSFVLNPLSNFLLGKLAIMGDNTNQKKIIRLAILGSILLTIFYFIIAVLTTPILVKILYPNYFNDIGDIYVVICVGAAIMSGVSLLKTFIMKYQGVKLYNIIFIIYGIILVLLAVILAIKYGLLGVAIAKVISTFLLYLSLIISMGTLFK